MKTNIPVSEDPKDVPAFTSKNNFDVYFSGVLEGENGPLYRAAFIGKRVPGGMIYFTFSSRHPEHGVSEKQLGQSAFFVPDSETGHEI
jgi:hypothetical protein